MRCGLRSTGTFPVLVRRRASPLARGIEAPARNRARYQDCNSSELRRKAAPSDTPGRMTPVGEPVMPSVACGWDLGASPREERVDGANPVDLAPCRFAQKTAVSGFKTWCRRWVAASRRSRRSPPAHVPDGRGPPDRSGLAVRLIRLIGRCGAGRAPTSAIETGSPELILASYSWARRDHMARFTRRTGLQGRQGRLPSPLREESLRKPEFRALATGTRRVMRSLTKLMMIT